MQASSQAAPLFFIDAATALGPHAAKKGPVGGTQAAILNLITALQDQGQACTLFNRRETETEEDGLHLFPIEALEKALAAETPRALIVCGRWNRWLIDFIRAQTTAPLLAWQHEALLNTELTPITDAITGVVFVSAWQAGLNKAALPPTLRTAIIGNAISPPFEKLLTRTQPRIKGRCVYAGMTPRGLINLIALWPEVMAARPHATLKVFCNPNLADKREPTEKLIAHIRALPGILHLGAVDQQTLAQEYAESAILLSPNPYPETSCITLMEAMAAGLDCVVTARAALPETAAGFARLCPVQDADNPHNLNVAVDLAAFLRETIAALDANAAPKTEQQAFAAAHYRWENRAAEWLRLMQTF